MNRGPESFARAVAMEALEGRVLLSSGEVSAPSYREVSGVVYSDSNHNGRPDAGEPVFAGASIYYDLNSNNQFDEGEAKVVTDQEGRYRLMMDVGIGLPVLIKPLTPPTGWVWQPLNIIEDDTANFAVVPAPAGAIRARIFDDVNGNGLMDGGEKPVAGVTVTLDGNPPGSERQIYRFAKTDAMGVVGFDALPVGEFGLQLISGLGIYFDATDQRITVAANEIKAIDVPIRLFSTIWGVVLEDRGQKPALPVSKVRVYLDENNNGRRDAGEMVERTDPIGQYYFYHAPAGRSTVRLAEIPARMRAISSSSSAVAVRGSGMLFDPIVLGRNTIKFGGRIFSNCNSAAAEMRGGHLLLCAGEDPGKKPGKSKPFSMPPSPSEKIDQGLWNAIQVHSHPLRFPMMEYYADPQSSRFTSEGRVQVDIYSDGSSRAHQADLEAMKLKIETVVDEPYLRALEGWATVKQIREVAKLPWVSSISLPGYALPPENPNQGPLRWVGWPRTGQRISAGK